MPQALESSQPSLTLADGLVRVLDAIVLAQPAEMSDRLMISAGKR